MVGEKERHCPRRVQRGGGGFNDDTVWNALGLQYPKIVLLETTIFLSDNAPDSKILGEKYEYPKAIALV